MDAFTAALLGRSGTMVDEMSFARGSHPKVEIEQVNDWEGSQYRYCNEFLVDSDTLDKDAALEFLSTMGDCELCVGEVPKFKVHVHSDHPDQVLKYFLDHGQISEVFIHNMQIQSAERTEKLAAEEQAERKALREEYLADWRRSTIDVLENTYIVDEKGNKRKLGKK